MLSFDAMYSACTGRDARFDGQFFMAVTSTGIFCRPSCPARKPGAANCRFYPSSAAAQDAGYRPCRRCVPEVSPGSPLWSPSRTAAGRALRLIDDGVVDAEGVGGLARRLGFSARHLGRLLVAETGAGPVAHARMHRARTARLLLTGSDLPVTDVAFAAGFGSVRQYNATMREVYAVAPSELRRGRHATGARLGALLAYREPFVYAGLLDWFRPRAIPGAEVVVEHPYARTLRLPGGPGTIHVAPTDAAALRLTCTLTDPRDFGRAVAIVRRLFDLDADPVAVDTELARDPALTPRVALRPGIRVAGAAQGLELVLRAIVGQQISVASATGILARLAGHGVAVASPVSGLSHVLPDAATPPATVARWYRGPATRRNALRSVLTAALDGAFVDADAADPVALDAELRAHKGIGPWTAQYAVLRITQHPDCYPPGDVALVAGARALHMADSSAELEARLESLRPWRSYACLHLWRAASEGRS